MGRSLNMLLCLLMNPPSPRFEHTTRRCRSLIYQMSFWRRSSTSAPRFGRISISIDLDTPFITNGYSSPMYVGDSVALGYTSLWSTISYISQSWMELCIARSSLAPGLSIDLALDDIWANQEVILPQIGRVQTLRIISYLPEELEYFLKALDPTPSLTTITFFMYGHHFDMLHIQEVFFNDAPHLTRLELGNHIWIEDGP